MKILVIAGHPADMFDHCGGTLFNHIKKGDEVTCVSLTQGLRVHDEVVYDLFRYHINNYTKEEIDKIIEERQKIKYKEAIDACAIFGINDVRFLNYDDEILTLNIGMVSKVATVIRETQPDLVITHWPYQYDTFSNHHAVTGQIALTAVTAAMSVNFEDRNPAAHVAQVAFMLCPADTQSYVLTNTGKTAYPSFYVDVTDVIDKKIKAINMMSSQKYDIEGYAKKTTESWNGNFGQKIRVAYAEAFALQFPEVGKTIPISDHRLWLANGDEKEHLATQSNLKGMHVDIDNWFILIHI